MVKPGTVIMSALAATLIVAGGARAEPHGKGGGHYGPIVHYSHGISLHQNVHGYAHPYWFKGGAHPFWKYRSWFDRYHCYGYYSPADGCWYYYYQPGDCWYPISYITTYVPTVQVGPAVMTSTSGGGAPVPPVGGAAVEPIGS